MDRVSERQVGVLAFTALLAPASAIPGVAARTGGELGWLGPILVLPLLALGGLGWRGLSGEGLAADLKSRWGRLGKGLLALYYIWCMTTAALTAGSCVDRLARTDYGWARPWALALALALGTAYLVRKGQGAFLRAVEVFYLGLLAVAGLFLVLGAVGLRWENLRPQTVSAEGVLKSVWTPAASLAVGGLAGFLPRERTPGERSSRWWWAGWCLVAAGLCLLVIGTLGAPVAARGPQPFFLALQGLGTQGGFQRLEALGTAAWVLSDLSLLGLTALAGRYAAGERSWGTWPVVAAAFLGGCLLDNQRILPTAGLLQGVNLVLGAGTPALLGLCRPRGEGISCG